MSRRRFAGTVVCAAVVAVVSGCGGLPIDGTVHIERELATAQPSTSHAIDVLPPRPRPEMTPAEVVLGFLRAQRNADDHHAIAREYLAPGTRWDDTAGVVVVARAIDDDKPVVQGITVTVTSPVAAVIGSDGAYRLQGAAQGSQADTFQVGMVRGQWRLSEVPAGLRLTASDVSRLYAHDNVYFLASSAATTLAPDPRYLPESHSSLATELIRALLAGPSPTLRPAVVSSAPAGAKLEGDVTVADGVATVPLGGAVQRASAAVRSQLSAQIVWTLSQLPVQSVRILAAGRPLAVPGVGDPQSRDDWAQYDPNVLGSGAPAYYVTAAGDRVAAFGGALGDTPASQPLAGLPGLLHDPAIAAQTPSGSTETAPLLAGLVDRPDGSEQLVAGTVSKVRPLLPAASFTPPSWGGTATGVWTVRTGSNQQIVYVPVDGGQVTPVSSTGLPADITRFEVSRDGTRVAAVAGQPTRQLYIGVIEHQAGGRLAIDQWQAVAPSLRQPSDVAWSDAATLAVIATADVPDGNPLPWLVSVDGSSVTAVTTGGLGSAPQRIAAGPDHPLLVQAPSAKGAAQIWQLQGALWRSVGDGRDPAYPG